MANASAASTSRPKVSMFAAKAKAGFVIPKNKLSGSLVPIFRGGKKTGGSDVVNEENVKLVQRKTKWGPDLTQDSAVRKGRALAYQTRVDQITKQLNSGILEMGNNVESTLEAQTPDGVSVHQISSEKSEVLELERREAIGEIIKLNPSYKAPPDYKPLLKEAKVPVPVLTSHPKKLPGALPDKLSYFHQGFKIKEHRGYNFIGLIFGSANDTQKRLEKETGAKVRVYGTKEDTGEKVEITSNDGNEVHGGYKELYVQVSADMYEKVDAAVALIELLVTPVSVNPSAVSTTTTSVSGDNTNVVDQSQGTSSPYAIPPTGVNQGMIHPVMGSGQPPAQGQSQLYPGHWFPADPPQTPAQPPTGFIPASNPSVPILSNPIQASSSLPFNPSNMPSLFGPRPVLPVGLPSVSQNSSLVQSRPQPPVLQRPFMPQPPFGARNPPMPTLQPSPQPNISAPPPITGNQPPPVGPPPMVGPSRPLLSQPMPVTASGSLSDRQLAHPSIRPASMLHLQSAVGPHTGPYPVISQSIVSPVNCQSRPSVPEPSGASGNHSIAPSPFASGPQPQAGPPSAPTPAPRPIQSSSIAPIPQMLQSVLPNPSLPPSSVGILTSVQGSAPSFTPIKPPLLTAPKPRPNLSDFTFQPHLPPNLASQSAPRPGMPPPIQNVGPPNLTEQSIPLATLTPSFQPPIHTFPQPVMQGNTRPQFNNQMNQTQGQIPPFPANAAVNVAPFRHPPYPNPNPQMGPRNLNSAPFVPNAGGGAYPSRTGNPPQLQQNYPGWRQSPLAPSQQPGNKLSFASPRPVSSPGTPQIYDPFSPTSVSAGPLQGGNPAKMRKQENDPEYEDLMASVGVK
ncbi:hypothetical protein NMG60_11033833 [Bertholletia excelsa]